MRVPGVVGERKVEGGSALYVAVMNLVYVHLSSFLIKGAGLQDMELVQGR